MTTINALHRGLVVLTAINDGCAQIREIAAATRLPKATVARIVETLVADGFLLQDDHKGYHPTPRVLTLSRGYKDGNFLLEVARPVLEDLRQHQIWPSDLAVFDQDAMVIMETGRDPGTLSLNRTVGSRLPVLVTALGRAFLAYTAPRVIEETLTRLSKSNNPFDAPARNPDAVRRLLAQVRRQGYATGDREYQRTTRTLAVPILANGNPAASLNIMVVPRAMSMEQIVRTLLPPMQQAAKTIGAALSHGRRQ